MGGDTAEDGVAKTARQSMRTPRAESRMARTPRRESRGGTPRSRQASRSGAPVARTQMGAVIKGYEDRLASRERKNRGPYFCEPENAQTYSQVRGGGGTSKEVLKDGTKPVRTRHVRDVDLPPPTPLVPFKKDPIYYPDRDNHEMPPEQRLGSSPGGWGEKTGVSAMTGLMQKMNNEDLTQTVWRADEGRIDLQNAIVSSKDKPLRLIPGSLSLSRPARLQMELIAAIVASKHKGYTRALLQQCSDSKCRLTRTQLRRAIKMLNVEPHDEILDALMGGGRYASDKDVASLIEGDMCSKDYEAPLGDPYLNTPFGVAQDAVKGIEETHDKLAHKWGSLESAFGVMDMDGSGQLSFEEFKVAVQKACPVNLSDKEVQTLFAEVDKDNSGQVNYSEFQSEFGKGSIFVPEFLKPRSLRQSRGGPIWQWDELVCGSNARRPFEIVDKHGNKRYHCKASHSYKLAKAFTEDAIAKRIHLCRDEMEKLERDQKIRAEQEVADHDAYVRAGKGLSAPPPRSRPDSRVQAGGRPPSCIPPWATNPNMSETYKFRINGTVPTV